ncbi:sigma-70 family RNA polymerase sigma factor [Streptomyces sp. NBC_01551]|uniref:RNA polymerase sigma factor n=1 Tax=Streptomyces sp. NBC_01551 TaxID=2975876 RepID=UPI0022520C0F|nr:sigma-70 family RNA polymerase sigma factor [Streptomyces sp. NBC_01551]MCX4529850.1 sigma-70 family RNA polymerase sigma factor [Streptomyces sp. NBC_01551]
MADAEFAALFVDLAPRTRLHLLYLGAQPAEAEEAVQDAMLSLLQALRGGMNVQHPKAWVRMVAARNFFRRKTTTTIRETLVRDVPDFAAPHSMDAEVATAVDVLEALKRLPARQATIMRLFAADYSVSEIADLLEMTPATVRSNLRHARKKLHLLLLG